MPSTSCGLVTRRCSQLKRPSIRRTIWLYAPISTKKGSIAFSRHTLTHTLNFYQVCHSIENGRCWAFLRWIRGKSQRQILPGWSSIATNVTRYQTCCEWQFFVSQITPNKRKTTRKSTKMVEIMLKYKPSVPPPDFEPESTTQNRITTGLNDG